MSLGAYMVLLGLDSVSLSPASKSASSTCFIFVDLRLRYLKASQITYFCLYFLKEFSYKMQQSTFVRTASNELLRKPVSKNPFYKTTNQSYNPTWELTQDSTIHDYTVPTFDEILSKK